MKQSHAAVLIGDFLAMHERKIKKVGDCRIRLPVEAGTEPMVGNFPGMAVRCESARVATVKIARKLVEQNHQRQAIVGFRAPIIEFARGGAIVQFAEPAANFGIDLVVAPPPSLRPDRFPVFKYRLRVRVSGNHVRIKPGNGKTGNR